MLALIACDNITITTTPSVWSEGGICNNRVASYFIIQKQSRHDAWTSLQLRHFKNQDDTGAYPEETTDDDVVVVHAGLYVVPQHHDSVQESVSSSS